MDEDDLPAAAVTAAAAEARALMRMEAGAEDALVERLAAAAILCAERFCGRVLVARADGSWTGVPAPLRQGVAMLAQHLFEDRGRGTGPPPAAVAALWRPYRVLRLRA